ncbi:signal peptidase II [Arcanobacterium hippocoleae]
MGFTLFAAVVTIAMPYFMYRMGKVKYQYVLAVIWSGALGNLLDRLFRDPGFGVGHVIDFIRYGNLFIGNIADIALVLGVITLIVMQFFESDADDKNETAVLSAEKVGANS